MLFWLQIHFVGDWINKPILQHVVCFSDKLPISSCKICDCKMLKTCHYRSTHWQIKCHAHNRGKPQASVNDQYFDSVPMRLASAYLDREITQDSYMSLFSAQSHMRKGRPANVHKSLHACRTGDTWDSLWKLEEWHESAAWERGVFCGAALKLQICVDWQQTQRLTNTHTKGKVYKALAVVPWLNFNPYLRLHSSVMTWGDKRAEIFELL